MPNLLEGSVNTPLGSVPKKAAVLVGGGLALLVVLMYFRGKKQDTTTTVTGEINPATGFVYGSAEDLAAMAAQGTAIGPVGGGGGGGVSNSSPEAFTTNAQWTQATIAGMTGSGIIEDASALSVALGKYIAGQPVGANTVTRSLIEQATAYSGLPPVAGPNGFPPAINTANPTTPEQPPATTPLPTSATAPAGKNLYDWCNEQGVSFVTVFGDEHGNGALNPGARNDIHWAGPAGSSKIPTFSTPHVLRIR